MNPKTMIKASRRLALVCSAAAILFGKNKARASMTLKADERRDENLSLSQMLTNQSPKYLNAPNVENLMSFARYQHALFCIKYANRNPSPRSYQRVFAELAKLTEQYDLDRKSGKLSLNSSAAAVMPRAAKGSDIDTKIYDDMKYVSEHSPNPHLANQYLNDGLARYISQLLTDDLMLQLAFMAPGVDNRFFRAEPPSTIEKLNRCCAKYANISKRFYYNAAPSSRDMDYAVLFEFYESVYKRLVNVDTKKATAKGAALLKKNANLKILLDKFATELNSLSLAESDYYSRSSLNVWSSDQTHIDLDELAVSSTSSSDQEDGETEAPETKDVDLKCQMKKEFVDRNESLVLAILDLLARVDIGEFVELGCLEQLLILYEKHKMNEECLTTVNNCLCLLSLESSASEDSDKYRKLFIQSGWLKRLNEMVNAKASKSKLTAKTKTKTVGGPNQLDYIYSMMELIGHKVLSNLNTGQVVKWSADHSTRAKILYAPMIYPLFPLYAESIQHNDLDLSQRDDEEHQHCIDVIFIHGLRGSLFRTWRQDDNSDMSKLDKVVSSSHPAASSEPEQPPQLTGPNQTTAIIDKLNTFIETNFAIGKDDEAYSFCWPKDWLPKDLRTPKKLDPSSAEVTGAGDGDGVETNVRLLGISYDSLYSLWGQDLVDDKKLKLTIKQRATDLIEQLRLAHVGTRPIVWVCHSMGGLIVKQLLVELAEQQASQLNKQRALKASGIESSASSSSGHRQPSIVDNTKAIVFFSTPHLGSQVAKTFSIFNFALYLSTEVSELSTNNAYLVDLNRKFLQLVRSKDGAAKDACKYNVLSICENLPTLITLNIYSKTVTEQSARAVGVGQFYLVDYKDHLNICKPDDRDCFIYKSVLELIKETARCDRCEREQPDKQTQAGVNFEFFQFTTFI